MKTWEVYKMLLENPNAKFKRLPHGDIARLNDKGHLVTTESGNRVDYPIPSVSQEWELVREPVSWQEAIQAWLEDKSIIVEATERGRLRQSMAFRFGLTDSEKPSNKGFNKKDFTEGKWYIED